MSDGPVNTLVLIGVGSSFVLSSLFYRLYQEKKKELEKLKEIPLFKPDKHLLHVLKGLPDRRYKYVAVEGLVQADGEPLASQFVPQCFGVIQKITVEEHWKFWNNLTRMWYTRLEKVSKMALHLCTNNSLFHFSRNSRTMNPKETSSVPFSLISPGAYTTDPFVKVQSPLEAGGCPLERVYHRVRRSEEGLVNLALQGLAGEKPVAMLESEELLRVGSILTGFGEVVLEGDQVMRLQAPQDDRKFILVATDYRSFIDRHESSATMWKTLTAVTGLTGASLLAGIIYNLGKQDDRSKKA